MAGFVILAEETRWSINNVGWRMIFEPVEGLLAPETQQRRAVADAVRGGLHYLDLTDATEATRRAKRAIASGRQGRGRTFILRDRLADYLALGTS